jgi:uncharacterized repeat protein (TIGR03833 family)
VAATVDEATAVAEAAIPRAAQTKALTHAQKQLQKKKAAVVAGDKRADIRAGLKVRIVLKADQRTGKLTEGVVKDILTNSPTHPHGIKVRLMSGEVGRVKEILS